jgi:hypothetical protein
VSLEKSEYKLEKYYNIMVLTSFRIVAKSEYLESYNLTADDVPSSPGTSKNRPDPR